jgi:hypothetical protein
MIQLDAAFRIGEAHAVCQDYALASPARADGGLHAVLLSDGCSSSPHTDIGARLLAHQVWGDLPRLTRQLAVCSGDPPPSVADAVLSRSYRRAARLANRLGLPGSCLDATLLGLVDIPGDGDGTPRTLYTLFYGDGAAAYGRCDDSLVVLECTYPAGYPFYPAYFASEGRLERWRGIDDNAQTLTRTVYAADGTVLDEQKTISEAPLHLFRTGAADLAGMTFAAVFSDGVRSFHREAETGVRAPVSYDEVIRELTAFKSCTGVFVNRRLRRFAEEAAARGWHQHDDLSVAAMAFDRKASGG